jgi:hypothetical protein
VILLSSDDPTTAASTDSEIKLKPIGRFVAADARYGMHQGIMRASKINNLLIMLEQGIFGTVRDYYVDSTG